MSQPARMPVLFLGHGSPMNALEDNAWSRGFKAIGLALPRPRAVLCISAHWFVPGTFTTANEAPETLHDFGGFPQELLDVQYPAPGDVKLAQRVVKLLGEERASPSRHWGLDHGTWSVLRHLLPKADVPVVQLSLDRRLAAEGHLALGEKLKELRDEGVLVLGSGNLTHNLRHAMTHGGEATPDWAARFDRDVASAVAQHDGAFLTKALATEAGRMSHPWPDHYLPLLYAVGAAERGDAVSFPLEGFDLGSLSMRSVRWG